MKNFLNIHKQNVSFSRRDMRVVFNIHLGVLNSIAYPFSTSVGTSFRTTKILNNHTKLANIKNPAVDKVTLDSEQTKIYKKGFVATFKNLEDWIKTLKWEKHMGWTKKGGATVYPKPNVDLTLNKKGIYMLTNNVNKKRYIGKSSNLMERFLNYSSKGLIEQKQSSMIHRALIKFGYDKFSITIIEYCKESDLNSREQYFINVLKPQYNIRKSRLLS